MTSDKLVWHGRSFLVALLFAAHVSWLASPPVVAAEESSDAYPQLIEQALAEFEHKNWPEARVLFRRAHELSPNARTLRGMGVVSYEMRDYVSAVRELSAALEDPRQPLTAAQRREVRTLLSRAQTFVAVYQIRVSPEDATLRLDGVPLEREPDGSVLLSFGPHTLTASKQGFESGQSQLSVQGGERGEIALTLSEERAPVAQEPSPKTPPVTTAHEPDKAPRATDVAKAGSEGKLRYTWVALGAGALFGAGAAGLWFLGKNDLDALDARCERAAAQGSPCERGETNTDAIERYQILTNVALGLTAGAVLTASVLAYFEWPREREIALGVGPTSVSVAGAF